MLVWAFQPLPELKGQLRFVECDDALGEQLIKSGKAQDPRVGNPGLKEVTDKPPAPQQYDTRDMTAKPRTTPRR